MLQSILGFEVQWIHSEERKNPNDFGAHFPNTLTDTIEFNFEVLYYYLLSIGLAILKILSIFILYSTSYSYILLFEQ